MAKKVIAEISLQIPGGQANPAPPVGPALGQHGVNIMEFCKAFNAETSDNEGTLIPVEIKVYADRSFDFITKSPPASVLLKQHADLEKGSGEPASNKVATVTEDVLEEIAEYKKEDLNAADMEAAKSMIAGTARSMGIQVAWDDGRHLEGDSDFVENPQAESDEEEDEESESEEESSV